VLERADHGMGVEVRRCAPFIPSGNEAAAANNSALSTRMAAAPDGVQDWRSHMRPVTVENRSN
jgi:hypothetical protein